MPDFFALRLALASDVAVVPPPRLNPPVDAGAPRAPKLGALGAVAPPNEKAGAAADGAWVAVAPKANAPPAAGLAAC